MKQESFCVVIRDVPFWFYVRESEHILGHLSLTARVEPPDVLEGGLR